MLRSFSRTAWCLALAAGGGLAAQDGEAIFRKSCMSCHTIGAGAKTGPDLKGVTTRRPREWALAFIQGPGAFFDKGDPVALQLLKEANNVKMPELGISAAEADAVLKLVDELTKSGKVLGSKGIDRPPTPLDLQKGKAMFEGRLRFAGGAPACLSCHSASGAGTFGGGRLGPHLNTASGKFGKNLATTIENPAFPSMVNVFAKKALTPEEAFQVAAYLHSVGAQPPPKKDVLFPIVGFVGLVGSLALGGRLGRKRFRGVRKNLVPKA
jgi:mono/diheme cytochrome c family protein